MNVGVCDTVYARRFSAMRKLCRKRWVFVLSLVLLCIGSTIHTNSVSAIAKESTLSINIVDGNQSISLMPGNFGKSNNTTVSVSTDNYSGYSLSVLSQNSTAMINSHEDEIESISSNVDESTFSSNSSYYNKWGFRPNQYVSTSGGVSAIVSNSDYLPAPPTSGLLIDKTNAANSVANEYTLSFAAKVGGDLPAGTYTHTNVITLVANDIVYNITYNANSTNTVTNMPSPNPQTATIDGGTPAEDSYVTLSDASPVQNEKKFAGWCDVATTTDSETGDDLCSGNLYKAGDDLPIDQTAAPNITLYAVWVETLFPVVWNQMGACEFHGATNGNITGSECTDYHNVRFIDTGIALYSQANYLKDYEIHFTIDHYNPAEQVNYYGSEDNNQQTFVNDKLGSNAGDKKAPGIVVRRNGNTEIDFNSKFDDSQVRQNVSYTQVHEVSVFRLDNKIYYSYDNGPLILLQDITGFNQQFDLTAWFGAYPRDDCTGDQGPCTNAKRIPEATLSNMYIRLGEHSDDDVHTITFNANDGAPATTTYLIKDGNTLSSLPTVTHTDHIFQGWFTAQSGGTEINSSTIPDGTTTYWAHWLGTVALANITNSEMALQPSDTETINVTNSAELEPYTFSSSNSSVATVDPSTGEVTAVAPGSATITMTGTTSGATKTILVVVSGSIYTVYFDAQGGTASVASLQVGEGGSISELPTAHLSEHRLVGWFSGTNGTGTELTTSTVFTSSTPTQYYAYWEESTYVCKVATKLHTETCNRTSNGCFSAGYANGSTITYGSLITASGATPVAGNAFTCDINGDSTFDEENERFYYIGMNGNNAKLLYYKNISNANEDYATGLTRLPTTNTTGWTNSDLVAFSDTDYDGVYEGKVARFMLRNEAVALCNNSTTNLGTNGKCLYILEKSNFANTNIRDGYWLGSTDNSRVQTSGRSITANSSNNGARPVIEVPMDYVSLDVRQIYTIVFDPHNGDSTTSVEIDEGNTLGANYPATDPTYANHLFQGWFTAETGGTQISASTVPDASATYHAQWLKTVTLAELWSDNISVEAGYSRTINVTNAAELEPYTFTSNDTSVATVNSTTGQVTGVANGTTTITMTGTTSGTTKTINVTVADLLPVTQAVIANNDLTLSEGGQITIIVNNSSLLEPYTFSSDNTSIATVDALTGVITGVWAGTTNIIMTGLDSGLTKTLEVNVTATPVITHTVTFAPNGGSFSDPSDSSKQVEDGDAVGTLPTPTRVNHKFFGWYTDDGTFYEEVYPDKIIDDNITFYAKWIEDTTSFPVVWSEINACTFNGGSSNVSGDYCSSENKTNKYINTAVALFSSTNYSQDFELGFNIVEYDSESNMSQATLVNSKRENSATNYPGFVMRKNDGDIELTSRWSNGSPTAILASPTTLKQVKIVRQNGVLKYSFNNGALTTYFDTTNNTHRFGTNVWFGAAVTSNDTGSQRYLTGTLTDMYIRLQASTDYVITFDANGGTASEGTRSIIVGNPIGSLPTATRTGSYTFDGWYNENNVLIDATYTPTSSETITAHWTYNASDTPVVFNVANTATQGYQTIINNWIQSPVNITTFNKNTSVINNSTWGDTSELAEADFWIGLKNNFQSNSCQVPSYGDAATTTPNPTAWTNGSTDCSKPAAYDTSIGAALDVYLYDTSTSSLGAQVTYAKAENGIIHNMIPGKTYYWEKSDDSTVYGYVTATSVNGRRFTDTGQIRNTRDLGGLPVDTDNDGTIDGTLEYGKLFRGERLWSASANATELTNLGITKEYDLSNGGELSSDAKLSDYQQDTVIHYNFDYNSGDENNASSNYMLAWNAVTDIMTDVVANKNIYFHCRVGADRTGTVAYLLEGLLGVPDEDRYEEYSLTHLSGLYDRTRYYKQKTSSNNLKFVYMMGYVQTTADILAWYMHNPNADASLISSFKSAMVR